MKRRHGLMLGLLLVLVVASAVAVVHTKYRSRQLFAELNRLDRRIDRLDLEWNALLIEAATWGAPQRIEREARRRLKMHRPRPEEIVIIQE